jgi:peptide/nickel transport system substrate-binding protein
MRRSLRIGALAAILAVVAACGGGDTGTGGGGSGSPVQGGILRVGSSGGVDSLNPFKGIMQDAYITFMYVYPVLVQYDGDLNFVGDFGTDWTVSDDGTQLTFTIAEGGTWSDGKPLTAADAAWTLEAIVEHQDGAMAMMGSLVKHIQKAEAPDDTTLVLTYDDPVNTDWALSQLNQIYVLPEHVWAPIVEKDPKDVKTFSNDPLVGGGPFVLTKYVKNDYAQFTTHEGYYGDRPLIDGFAMKWYTNDDAMVTALQNGELDVITTVPPQTFDTLSADTGLVVAEAPGLEFYDLIFNSAEPLHAEIADPKLRQAMAHAIDMQKIVDTVLLGHGEIGSTIVPVSTPKWHADIEQRAFDTAEANRLLDEMGFARGADDVRVANGHPMSYEVLTPSTLAGVDRVFEIVQEGLAEVGIEVKQRSLDSDAVWTQITGTDGDSYDEFDLAIWDWVPLIDPDFILSVMTCEQLGGWSDTGYCDEGYDALYDEQGRTVDTEERAGIVDEMQRIVFDDSPYIVLYYVNAIDAHSTAWDGLLMSPQGSINSLSKLSLEQVHRSG